MSEIILRPATVDDAAEMLAIYAPYVIQTTVSSEYDAPTLEEFTRRIRTFTEKLPWLVCIIDGEVAGYGYASPHRTRGIPVVGGDLDLCRAGLAPPRHRRRDLRRAVRGARDAGLL